MVFYGKNRHHTVSFGDVYIIKPTVSDMVGPPRLLYPHEARIRSCTYSLTICADMVHKQRDLTPEEKLRQAERAQKRLKTMQLRKGMHGGPAARAPKKGRGRGRPRRGKLHQPLHRTVPAVGGDLPFRDAV